MVIFHLAADPNLFSIGNHLTAKLGALLGAVLIFFIGAKALHHIGNDRHGAALGIALVAIIPAAFILDPKGMEAVIKSTVHAIGG